MSDNSETDASVQQTQIEQPAQLEQPTQLDPQVASPEKQKRKRKASSLSQQKKGSNAHSESDEEPPSKRCVVGSVASYGCQFESELLEAELGYLLNAAHSVLSSAQRVGGLLCLFPRSERSTNGSCLSKRVHAEPQQNAGTTSSKKGEGRRSSSKSDSDSDEPKKIKTRSILLEGTNIRFHSVNKDDVLIPASQCFIKNSCFKDGVDGGAKVPMGISVAYFKDAEAGVEGSKREKYNRFISAEEAHLLGDKYGVVFQDDFEWPAVSAKKTKQLEAAASALAQSVDNGEHQLGESE